MKRKCRWSLVLGKAGDANTAQRSRDKTKRLRGTSEDK